MKNSNDTIGYRTLDLPTCIAVPQPTAPPRTSSRIFIQHQIYSVIQKDGLNFVRLYFLNYAWYVNDLHSI